MPLTLLQRVAHENAPARRLLARLWRAYAMRGLRPGGDNHLALDRFYALPDPWDMASDREQARFRHTNALIQALAAPVGTLLEIGCGEAHQSAHLAQVCQQLDGVDVSARAVDRARARLPAARFGVGALDALPWPAPTGGRYDLVVACEVLYYMDDIGHAVQQMSTLGRACLVSFFGPASRRVAVHLEGIEGLQRGWFQHAGQTWLWAYWRPLQAGAAPTP
jgi:SAM-dependent methyltransferase